MRKNALPIACLIAAALVFAAACKSNSPGLLEGAGATPAVSATPTATITATATPTPTATPTRTPRPRKTPQPRRRVKLPAVFRGCWQGTVSRLDWINRLPGAPPIGPWTAKTYRLCYRRLGGGPYRLSFADTGMAANPKVTNPAGHGEVLSTDGRTRATMRAYLDFDEYTFNPGSRTFHVDEVTDLNCEIRAAGLMVTGTVEGERSGRPWFRAQWHAVFERRGG